MILGNKNYKCGLVVFFHFWSSTYFKRKTSNLRKVIIFPLHSMLYEISNGKKKVSLVQFLYKNKNLKSIFLEVNWSFWFKLESASQLRYRP